ncbi:SDR family oxidoreductase [Vibrio chagasii]|uniref:SDR family oxidoreductase n=1 Tax=Vibrio chagasii TaxID=170679 RepID=UPI0038CD2922
MKTVMITGCSTGFGLATAHFFLEKGWNVIATMRTPDPSRLPQSSHLTLLPLDVTNSESIESAVKAAGEIDVLINNAGIGFMSPYESTSPQMVRNLFETNTFGTFEMIRAVLPQMRKRRSGTIINLSSSTTLKPLSLMGAYTASKAAVTAYTECLELELAPLGIRTRLVVPGMSPTTSFGDNAREQIASAGKPPSEYDAIVNGVLESFQKEVSQQTLTTPEDVVNAIWLAVTDPNSPVVIPAGADAVALS